MDIVDRLNQLESQVRTLQTEVCWLRENKKEIYYQRFLEKHFQASHRVTKYGITDITTDLHHVEIKIWKNYKACLGQLQSYNHVDKRSLIAAFYGDYADKDKVIELFHAKHIEVWDLKDAPNGIAIEKFVLNTENKDFHEWLKEHVVFEQGSILKLKDICETYLMRQVGPRTMSSYKKDVEYHIQEHHHQVYHVYRDQFWRNGDKCRGWEHLSLVTQ